MVPSAADGDAAFFLLLVVDPGDGGQVGGEVRVAEDVAGRDGQDECLGRHGGRTTGEPFAVGGDQTSAVLGREQHAVEDLAGGVGGRATGDVGEAFHGGGRQLGDGADGFGTFGELLGVERGKHRGGLDAAAPDGEADLRVALSAAGREGNLRALVGAAGGFHGIRRDEETQRLEAVVADPGFEPVVEIGGGEVDAVRAGGEQQVAEHRQLAAQMLQAAEELLRAAQGVGWDVDGGHGW